MSATIHWTCAKCGSVFGAGAAEAEVVALRASLAEAGKIMAAFGEHIALGDHYAVLLNGYDGGRRLTFGSPRAWMDRLVFLRDGAERTSQGEGG